MGRRVALTTHSRTVKRNGVMWMFMTEDSLGTRTWIARRWTGVQWVTVHCINF